MRLFTTTKGIHVYTPAMSLLALAWLTTSKGNTTINYILEVHRRSPLLHEQHVHRAVCDHQEDGGHDGEAERIAAHRQRVEAKGAEDGRAWNVDV